MDIIRSMKQDRDLDGNIISNEPAEVRTYSYGTGTIPSERLERLIVMISTDFRQALMVFHQLVQGKSFQKINFNILAFDKCIK